MDRMDEEWDPGVGAHGAPRRHFRIVKLLGVGGFGSVYEALLERPDGFRKTVALKILHDEDVPPYVLRRFRDEAKVLGLLRDRAIVSVDVPTKLMDRWSIIMECIDGATASQVLKFIGPTPPRVALSIVGEIARALHKVYHLAGDDGQAIQLIHRDIKAANVAITREGDVKILDFGIARANFSARESSTLQNAGPDGTVGYIAPERFEGLEGPEGDIYSLGVTLYVMLTRVRPTHIDRRVDHPEAAMRSALEVAVSMCELNAEKRPTAQEIYRQCRSLVERMPGPSLSEWAERVVPDAQEAAQRHLSMSEEGDKLGLVGTILTEEPSKKPIMTAAPVTPPGRPARVEAPPPATPMPSAEGDSPRLRVKTTKVRVPTGDVARGSRPPAPPRANQPRSGVTRDPTRPPSAVRQATPSRTPGSIPPAHRSVPPPPSRTRKPNPSLPPRSRTPVPTGARRRTPIPSGAIHRTPVSAGARQHGPPSVVPRVDRTNPGPELTNSGRERTNPGRDRTNPGRERTNPRREWTNPGRERTNPRYDTGTIRRNRTQPRTDARIEIGNTGSRFTTSERPARPSRFLAAGFAGVLTAVGLLAVLAVGALWVAENRPEWLDAAGVDPALLEIPVWMIPGGLSADPEVVDPEEPTAQPVPAPTAKAPRAAKSASAAPQPDATPDPVEPSPASEGASADQVGVRLMFQPAGVDVTVDGREVVLDSPRSTTITLPVGTRSFQFVTPDGVKLARTIDVGGELGSTLIELRDGALSTCRPPSGITRCTQ
ncbi:MAG: protein kinase [Myxococcota bacterium]